MDKNNGKKVFNFGDSPLMKQTEKKVTEQYEAIEKKEQGALDMTGLPAQSPLGSEQSSAPVVQPIREATAIQAAPAVGAAEPTQNINVPIPVSLHQQLKVYAARTKQNMKDLVVMAIREYMAAQGS